jgi:hypothetical protein
MQTTADWMRTIVKSTKIKVIARRETVRVISVGKSGSSGWCSSCGAFTLMVTPDSAALLCTQTTRTIYRQVEAGFLHYTEGPEGLRVCVASLKRSAAT